MFKCIGVCQGWGAENGQTQTGPKVLHETFKAWPWSSLLQTQVDVRPDEKINDDQRYAHVLDISKRLSEHTARLVRHNQKPIVFGGDHSIAIGTWSGVVSELSMEEQFGLLWVDAHMDSHTHETSPSGNIHGMPVACLLGEAVGELSRVGSKYSKLNPKHIAMLGIRSYESGEKALLERLGVRVYYMSEIHERGFGACFKEALDLVTAGTKGFGISMDIDALDPTEAPATGCFEPDGLMRTDALNMFRHVREHAMLKAVEITEYNPYKDTADKKTQVFIENVVDILTKGES